MEPITLVIKHQTMAIFLWHVLNNPEDWVKGVYLNKKCREQAKKFLDKQSNIDFQQAGSSELWNNLASSLHKQNIDPKHPEKIVIALLNNHEVETDPARSFLKVGCTDVPLESLDKIAREFGYIKPNLLVDYDEAYKRYLEGKKQPPKKEDFKIGDRVRVLTDKVEDLKKVSIEPRHFQGSFEGTIVYETNPISYAGFGKDCFLVAFNEHRYDIPFYCLEKV